MKEINLKFDLSRARNAEHFQFHTDMLNIVSEEFADEQGIAPQRAAYKQLWDIENECYLRNRTYKDTAAVEIADRNRDDLFLYTAQTITTGKLCPIESKRQAAIELDYLLVPYRNAPRLNYTSNTAAISDFLEKIRKPEYVTFVTALDLDEVLTSLATANNEFNTIYTERSAETLSRATSETMKSTRPLVDKAYREIVLAINALYRVNFLITNDVNKDTALGMVIDQANALIIQLQQTLSKAGVGAKPNFRPDTDGGSTDSGNGGGTGGESDRPEIE